ncbi:hypothetical protein BFS06_13990 [Clostridium perfringens]|uniref:Putative hydrolase n=1 Tax=Clostridium perfringens TaxID=1502 RepID=A0A140GRL9_CLOPF|nr:hypothetical protein [Clostridium perfringens]AMN31178.1 putative hydrolase [Clostridium perfringens]TBX14317.1 hypothetical protein BFS06_13990 [Clostridium perfringens]
MTKEENIRIITICGSSRFKEETLKLKSLLQSKGYIVFSSENFTKADGIHISKQICDKLAYIHNEKIKMSDMIFVLNKNGYIGESTRQEINFAKSLNIPIKYLE